MAFKPSEVETLLAATGRRCCLCSRLHRVQVEIRARFRQSLSLDEMLFRWRYPPSHRMDWMMEDRFRGDRELGKWMDEKRREAIGLMNSILRGIDHPELRGLQ